MTSRLYLVFFFNDTATTEIYTLSLHDALPILAGEPAKDRRGAQATSIAVALTALTVIVLTGLSYSAQKYITTDPSDELDRKSTRLNSSHANISYAVFCLKKKKTITIPLDRHDD